MFYLFKEKEILTIITLPIYMIIMVFNYILIILEINIFYIELQIYRKMENESILLYTK